MTRPINKILVLHAGWLWDQGQQDQAEHCYLQANKDRRDKHGRKIITRNKNGQFTFNKKIKSIRSV